MKNRKHILTALIVLNILLLASCGKDKEEVEPQTEIQETAIDSDKEDDKAQVTTEVKEEKPKEEKITPEAEQKEEAKESDLKKDFMEKTGKKEKDIAVFEQDDYDGDGKEEAFILVGEVIEEYEENKTVSGSLWFISEKDCKKLSDTISMGFNAPYRTMKMGKTNYVLIDEVYVTARVTQVWYVEDGKAVEAPFSLAGEVIVGMEGDPDRFRIMDSSYDATYDVASDMWLGHTWKSYYFFYDSEDDKIHEYGGTEIDDATAEYWCGKDIVEELLPKGDKIDSLFCRGNSLIVLNYEHEEDGCIEYYHYIYDFNKGCLVDDTRSETTNEPLNGIYHDCLCPELASYPEVPGPNM